ncbi:RnfABCDGE type electron transport complex subunit D, partial [Neisseria sicca]|uniref:RnfABCDGE type electron transport complex subunit D n=1 Tax=Neisseria sicca TaxID=490 RepID=UPI0034D98722
MSWMDGFIGKVGGCMGEVWRLGVLMGGGFMVFGGIGCWGIIGGVMIGMIGMCLVFNVMGWERN